MELIDALCVLEMGWSTEDEKKVFNAACEVVSNRVDYLRTKMKHEELTAKLAEYDKAKAVVEPILQAEYNRRRDKMAEDMANR